MSWNGRPPILMVLPIDPRSRGQGSSRGRRADDRDPEARLDRGPGEERALARRCRRGPAGSPRWCRRPWPSRSRPRRPRAAGRQLGRDRCDAVEAAERRRVVHGQRRRGPERTPGEARGAAPAFTVSRFVPELTEALADAGRGALADRRRGPPRSATPMMMPSIVRAPAAVPMPRRERASRTSSMVFMPRIARHGRGPGAAAAAATSGRG